MAWLGTWKYRQKITIDSSAFTEDVTHFPLPVVMNTLNGNDDIFTELGANSLKIAFTKADEITQLYGEIEYWDEIGKEAVVHISKSDWVISSTVSTEYYIYFDSAQLDNSTYIGGYASVAGRNVWDSNYKMVYHMGDSLLDSTVNGNDVVNTGTTTLKGLTGLARDFDGADDYLELADFGLFSGAVDFTVMAQVSLDILDTATGTSQSMFHPRNEYDIHLRYNETTQKIEFKYWDGALKGVDSLATPVINTYYTYDLVLDNGVINGYVDGVLQGTFTGFAPNVTTGLSTLGSQYNTSSTNELDGKYNEFRISDIARSSGWVNAEKESLTDNVNTFNSTEIYDPNEPPYVITPPDISSTFYYGNTATPVFGTWGDTDGTVVSVVRTWLLDSIPLVQSPDTGDLLLLSEWEGGFLQLKEEAFDNLGASAIAISTAYEIIEPQQSQLWNSPIYDRTKNDVDLLKTLSEQIKLVGWDNASTDQREQWLQVSTGITKGALNSLDLNRIDSNILYLRNYLRDDYGLTVLLDTSNPVWFSTNIPLQSQIDRIRDNVKLLLNGSYKPLISPELEYSNNPNWDDINDIERNLYELKRLLDRIPEGYKYCGSFNCGQNIVL